MKEQREAPRYEVVLKVRYETDEAFQNAVIHNLSSGGVYLATATPFDVGGTFQMEIELPERNKWIKASCRVVWVNEIDTAQFPKGMGVMFLETPPGYEDLVKESVAV